MAADAVTCHRKSFCGARARPSESTTSPVLPGALRRC
jgi:hypothetical protein